MSEQVSTSELKFTPGPWGVEQTKTNNWVGPLRRDGKTNQVVVSLNRHQLKLAALAETDANARLIASAPTLLEALKQCLLNIESDEFTHGRNFGAGNVARDAIEAATGVRPKEVV